MVWYECTEKCVRTENAKIRVGTRDICKNKGFKLQTLPRLAILFTSGRSMCNSFTRHESRNDPYFWWIKSTMVNFLVLSLLTVPISQIQSYSSSILHPSVTKLHTALDLNYYEFSSRFLPQALLRCPFTLRIAPKISSPWFKYIIAHVILLW